MPTPRITGAYRTTTVAGEAVRAFLPSPLPPKAPPLVLDAALAALHAEAVGALARLEVAGSLVPDPDWFLYGFVRKEAVVTSRIEGTQATLEEVVAFEATNKAVRPADVEEVCNYVEALNHSREALADPKGLPICARLLSSAHKRLMKGVRGADKRPGVVRTTQNWVGGSRPGNAAFVPPPPEAVPEALAALEKWIHAKDPLPPLVRIGLAHVQFETIHPYLDGNGRIGRLLIALLLEHWNLLPSPLLYVSTAFNRRRTEYYDRLGSVRTAGDWEGWTRFFLSCVREAADDAVAVARAVSALITSDRRKLTAHPSATLSAIRLFELIPTHPMLTLARTVDLLAATKPTALKSLDALQQAGVLAEITGRRRDRVFAYRAYLDVLGNDT